MPKITLSLILSLLLSTTVLDANSQDFAKTLINLRGEVEELDSTLAQQKDSYKSSISSLHRQKEELVSIISREDLKIKQAQYELDKVRKEIKEASRNSDGLKPIVLNALDLIIANIKDSIPFKINERINDVLKIKEQLQSDLINSQKALALTWNLYTDTLRMTKENGIFKQTISLNGEERLAQIARVGTVMMFFKTPDDIVGYVAKDGKKYMYKSVDTKNEKEQILSLFDAFKKQIRTGYFTLPHAIVSMETK